MMFLKRQWEQQWRMLTPWFLVYAVWVLDCAWELAAPPNRKKIVTLFLLWGSCGRSRAEKSEFSAHLQTILVGSNPLGGEKMGIGRDLTGLSLARVSRSHFNGSIPPARGQPDCPTTDQKTVKTALMGPCVDTYTGHAGFSWEFPL